MADFTENYNLIKPSEEDFYNIEDFNNNADIVDAQLKALSATVESSAQENTLQEVKTDVQGINAKIGNTADGTGVASIFGKLAALLSWFTGTWTSARAGKIDKLDNLDTTVSSRAPSGTALSNAIWTNARAGYLDFLNNGTYGLSAIRTLLNTVNTNTSRSVIKSVQRGVIIAPTVINISTVDSSKSMVLLDGISNNGSITFPYVSSLTNTQLSIKSNNDYWATNSNVSWQLIEFY